MTNHRFLSAGTAAIALAVAAPAVAQDMTYEASPVLSAPPGDGVVYQSEPVVVPDDYYDFGQDEETVVRTTGAVPHHSGTYAAAHNQYAGHAAPGYAAPQFDRTAWLEECRERTRGVERKNRGGIIGGLLGGIAGGVVGNRAWDSERLAGTLIGGAVGGIAGAAIGAAIGKSGERRDAYDCEAYLDQYLAGYRADYGYGYGQTYGQPVYGYTMVPVPVRMVQVTYAVPQRAVVREVVTEEWYDEPVEYVPPATRVIERPAPTKYVPVPDKRTRSVKPVKSIK